MPILLILFVVNLSFSGTSLAEYIIPEPSESLQVIEPGIPAQSMPAQFKMLVWNVHKGKNGAEWAQDLRRYADFDLLLLQEAMLDDFMPAVFAQLSPLQTTFVKSFVSTQPLYATGVATLTRAQSKQHFFHRSQGTEPFTQTPKVSLLQVLSLAHQQDLLVINTHAINFVSLSTFQEQMNEVASLIAQFSGPVIWAGDFNTWSPGRTEYLKKLTETLGLRQIDFANDSRFLALDHVFVRGCTALKARIDDTVDSSDHDPLSIEWECAPYVH